MTRHLHGPARRVLIVSNGHGEDAVGARLAAELLGARRDLELLALPLVGRGAAYEGLAPPLGPRREMPSGGFMLTSPGVLAQDLRAGFAAMSREQYRALAAARPDAVLVCGDVYALWAALRFSEAPVWQVQPLVSVRYQEGMTPLERLGRLNRTTVDGFVGVERRLMRRAERVWARDEPSAAWLRAHGVPGAASAGNVMMDLAATPELDLRELLDGRPVLALLPGTRRDHHDSLPLMLSTLDALGGRMQALAALPASLALGVRLPPGWSFAAPGAAEHALGVRLSAVSLRGQRVPFIEQGFVALLHSATVALGTSGTGNEQAAGLGVPVVGFPTRGPQYLPAFARAQRRLLGAALTLSGREPRVIAASVLGLLDGPARVRAAQEGRARLGPPGAARSITRQLVDDWS